MTDVRNGACRVVRAIAAIAAVTVGGALQVSRAVAATNPYTANGFDASYPQGSAPVVPTGFGIIGVTHGRPFTVDTSASTLWGLTGPNRSLYFNTGYALAYAKSETTSCASLAQGISFTGNAHQVSTQRTAWAIGCSEAAYAVTSAPGTPSTGWVDIETGNSWSSTTSLNDATISGMVTELGNLAPGVPVGVYSTPSMWNTIAGSAYVNAGIVADWGAGHTSCPSSDGFTKVGTSTVAPLWLEQIGTVVAGGVTFDADTAC